MQLSEQDITRLRYLQVENKHGPKPEGATGTAPNECNLCGARGPCDEALLLEGLRRAAVALYAFLYDGQDGCGECGSMAAPGSDTWAVVHEQDCRAGAAEAVLVLLGDGS